MRLKFLFLSLSLCLCLKQAQSHRIPLRIIGQVRSKSPERPESHSGKKERPHSTITTLRAWRCGVLSPHSTRLCSSRSRCCARRAAADDCAPQHHRRPPNPPATQQAQQKGETGEEHWSEVRLTKLQWLEEVVKPTCKWRLIGAVRERNTLCTKASAVCVPTLATENALSFPLESRSTHTEEMGCSCRCDTEQTSQKSNRCCVKRLVQATFGCPYPQRRATPSQPTPALFRTAQRTCLLCWGLSGPGP